VQIAANNAQPENQREYVPPVVGNGAVQGRAPDPHQINAGNYGMTDYPLPGVRNYISIPCVVAVLLAKNPS
jgi:hypothetical protein